MSELLDRGARTLLERAYAERRGTWVMTRLADPTDTHRAWARRNYDIDLDGPDNAPTLSGTRQDARSRWGRAFVRALWYNHRKFGPVTGGRAELRGSPRMAPNPAPLQIEWGRRLPALGIIPAGRAVRIRVPAGGQTALRVVKSKPDRARIYEDDGAPGGRFAIAEQRDWGA